MGVFNDDDYMLWRLISQAVNAIRKARGRELLKYNCTLRKAAILIISYATEGRITPYKIARWLIREPHSIYNSLEKMEQNGLLTRTKQQGKKHKVNIGLTEKGYEAYQEVIKMESIRGIFSSLSSEERKQLIPILRKLRDNALERIWLNTKLLFPP